MKYKVNIKDIETNECSENIIELRKGTKIKTFILKSLEHHIEQYASDPLSFISEIKYIYRESYDYNDFIESLKLDLQLIVNIYDLNNNKYYNNKKNTYTTSYEVGRNSYHDAYLDQINEVDGEKDFDKYLPDFDEIVLHGNELCNDDYFIDDWELCEY